MNVINTNQIVVSGEILSESSFDHEVMGEKFYKTQLSTLRKSGNEDILPIMISERLINAEQELVGQFVKINGQVRTYNRNEDNTNKLILHVFVRDFEIWSDDDDGEEVPDDENNVFLDGFICKNTIYRKTPLGRKVADILLAVNRPYGKTDYIPCIVWGRNARFTSGLEVGTHIRVRGRLQSREYQKKIGENEVETRVAYEVSVSRIEVVEETEE